MEKMTAYYLFIFSFYIPLLVRAIPFPTDVDYEIDVHREDNYGSEYPNYDNSAIKEPLLATGTREDEYLDYYTQESYDTKSNINKQIKNPEVYTKAVVDDLYQEKNIDHDLHDNSKIVTNNSENYTDDPSQSEKLDDSEKSEFPHEIFKDMMDNSCIDDLDTKQISKLASNISLFSPEDDLKVPGEVKRKRKTKVYSGEAVTLCWIETVTIKEDQSITDAPNRQVFREYAISFENSFSIPNEHLDCPKRGKTEIRENSKDNCNTSFTEGISHNTKKSKSFKTVTSHNEGNINITELKLIKCGVGSLVTKDVVSIGNNPKDSIKRIEIKVSPTTFKVAKYCNGTDESQDVSTPNDLDPNVTILDTCVGNDCNHEETLIPPTILIPHKMSDSSESDEILSAGYGRDPSTKITLKMTTPIVPKYDDKKPKTTNESGQPGELLSSQIPFVDCKAGETFHDGKCRNVTEILIEPVIDCNDPHEVNNSKCVMVSLLNEPTNKEHVLDETTPLSSIATTAKKNNSEENSDYLVDNARTDRNDKIFITTTDNPLGGSFLRKPKTPIKTSPVDQGEYESVEDLAATSERPLSQLFGRKPKKPIKGDINLPESTSKDGSTSTTVVSTDTIIDDQKRESKESFISTSENAVSAGTKPKIANQTKIIKKPTVSVEDHVKSTTELETDAEIEDDTNINAMGTSVSPLSSVNLITPIDVDTSNVNDSQTLDPDSLLLNVSTTLSNIFVDTINGSLSPIPSDNLIQKLNATNDDLDDQLGDLDTECSNSTESASSTEQIDCSGEKLSCNSEHLSSSEKNKVKLGGTTDENDSSSLKSIDQNTSETTSCEEDKVIDDVTTESGAKKDQEPIDGKEKPEVSAEDDKIDEENKDPKSKTNSDKNQIPKNDTKNGTLIHEDEKIDVPGSKEDIAHKLNNQTTENPLHNNQTEEIPQDIDHKNIDIDDKKGRQKHPKSSDLLLKSTVSTQPSSVDVGGITTPLSILLPNTEKISLDIANKTKPDRNAKPKLALKIRVSLEHIGENKEQSKLADIEKDVTLSGSTLDRGNNFLLQHLRTINNTDNNFDSIKQLLNCTILDKISNNIIPEPNSRRNMKQKNNDKRIYRGSGRKKLIVREKRDLDSDAESDGKNFSSVNNSKIKECLSEIHEDIKTGLTSLLSEISNLRNKIRNKSSSDDDNSVNNSTLQLNLLDVAKQSNDSITLDLNNVDEKTRNKRSASSQNAEELSRWSNERIISLDKGEKLHSITELILFNDPETS